MGLNISVMMAILLFGSSELITIQDGEMILMRMKIKIWIKRVIL